MVNFAADAVFLVVLLGPHAAFIWLLVAAVAERRHHDSVGTVPTRHVRSWPGAVLGTASLATAMALWLSFVYALGGAIVNCSDKGISSQDFALLQNLSLGWVAGVAGTLVLAKAREFRILAVTLLGSAAVALAGTLWVALADRPLLEPESWCAYDDSFVWLSFGLVGYVAAVGLAALRVGRAVGPPRSPCRSGGSRRA
jgi:hypothetical protein